MCQVLLRWRSNVVSDAAGMFETAVRAEGITTPSASTCHTSTPCFEKHRTCVVVLNSLCLTNFNYIDLCMQTHYNTQYWNEVPNQNSAEYVPKKGSISIPQCSNRSFSWCVSSFFCSVLRSIHRGPNEHGFPAGLIPAGQHPPCIHRFKLGQRHGFPAIRALISWAG